MEKIEYQGKVYYFQNGKIYDSTFCEVATGISNQILSSRITGVSAKKQRKLSKAIKRARNLALLSFIEKNENN